MPISDELKQVYSSAPVDVHHIETLELQHPIFQSKNSIGKTNSVYLVNQIGGLNATTEDGAVVDFEPASFAVIPPNSQESNAIQLQVALDNTSRRLVDSLEQLNRSPNIPIVCLYRVYLSDDFSGPQNDPPLKLYVLSVTASDSVVTFNAGLANIRKIPFPSVVYNVRQFQGLKR